MPHGLQATVKDTTVIFNGINTVAIVGTPPDILYGKTDVEQEFWNAWLEQNKGLEMVRNGFIFADTKPQGLEAKAKDSEAKTGFEKLQPDTQGVTTADKE